MLTSSPHKIAPRNFHSVTWPGTPTGHEMNYSYQFNLSVSVKLSASSFSKNSHLDTFFYVQTFRATQCTEGM